MRQTGRKSVSPKIKINPAGIHAKAKMANTRISQSANALLCRSRLEFVAFAFMVDEAKSGELRSQAVYVATK